MLENDDVLEAIKNIHVPNTRKLLDYKYKLLEKTDKQKIFNQCLIIKSELQKKLENTQLCCLSSHNMRTNIQNLLT